ncbi:Retinol dehydrogenase 12 [Actinomortierella ambigua]|nr:Retinol dehydrogenase 12 [Actinomortierella ambigua]
MDVERPPRANWHDKLVINISEMVKTWPYAICAGITGVMEIVLNIWQFIKQRNILELNSKRRRLWIEQARARSVRSDGKPKVAVVTGGNTGLGYETALALVEAGYFTILACRNIQSGANAAKRIAAATGKADATGVMALDLSSFASIRSFIEAFRARGYGLDVLVNNAGVMDMPYQETADGYEMQFGVNHLGHYLLTLGLLPLLNQAEQGRIVVLSSAALFASDGIPYHLLRTRKDYSRLGHYSHSKLANVLFTKALDRRLRAANSNVTVNACHPGACYTELFRNDLFMFLLMKVGRIVSRSPAHGAMSSIYLALAPEVEPISGEYFFDTIPRSLSRVALDRHAQEMLWIKSVEYTMVDFKL